MSIEQRYSEELTIFFFAAENAEGCEENSVLFGKI
jgi:hypothetical protein